MAEAETTLTPELGKRRGCTFWAALAGSITGVRVGSNKAHHGRSQNAKRSTTEETLHDKHPWGTPRGFPQGTGKNT